MAKGAVHQIERNVGNRLLEEDDMPKGFKLDWKGDDVLKQVVKATKEGIDEVMGECVVDAQADTPVLSGTLRRSEKIQEPAHEEGDVVVGVWGSADVDYALPVEAGARGRPGRNMLRNAADKNYPRLEETIAKRLRRG